MQKVPRIQKKSDEFHRREQETADRILDKVEEINNEGQSTQEDPIQTINKDTLKNIRQKIRFIFTK